jgi:hypothetical protein
VDNTSPRVLEANNYTKICNLQFFQISKSKRKEVLVLMLANHNDQMYPNPRCSKLERISFISFQHAPFMLAIDDSLDAVAFSHLKTYL